MNATAPRAPRALIAEDEPILAAALRQALLRLWPGLDIAAVAENGVDAVEQALACRPDLLFLDIKMPGKSGLDAAQELAEDWPADTPFPLTVFVTAYDDYALQAFEQAAADYVLKPVTDARLGKTVERLQSRLAARGSQPDAELERIAAQLRSLAPAHAAGARLNIIRAAVGNQVRFIPVEDILYFEAADKYVSVITREGESLIRLSLRELVPQLDPERFWQIHRGTVVNSRHVHAAVRDESGKLSLKLKDYPKTLAVSRIYAHLFRQM